MAALHSRRRLYIQELSIPMPCPVNAMSSGWNSKGISDIKIDVVLNRNEHAIKHKHTSMIHMCAVRRPCIFTLYNYM